MIPIKRIRAVFRPLRRAMLRIQWWLQYPKVKLFFPGDRVGYSQSGQDQILMQYFFKNKKGVFLDIGSNDPKHLNNTYLFEKNGWEGFAFEPLEKFKSQWISLRKNTELHSVALGDRIGDVEFIEEEPIDGWEDMLSRVAEKGEHNIRKTTIVKMERLDSFDIGKKIDFVSIDVEGHELNVLHGMDFESIDYDVFVIENNRAENVRWGGSEIREFMQQQGYHFWGRIFGMDDIFIKEISCD
jgi:FkbM family methyltransferase